MSWLVFVLLAAAGGLGAVVRLVLDGVIRSRAWTRLPWGTIVINASGSLLLGFLTGLAAAHVLGPEAAAIAGTGFLGGYTTFSTASVETVRLLQERRVAAAAVNALGTLVVSALLAGLGLWLGSAL